MPSTFTRQPLSRFSVPGIRPLFALALWVISSFALCVPVAFGAQDADTGKVLGRTSTDELGKQLRVGDVVFIRVSAFPFKKVASATNSWTNHVGVVIDVSGPEPVIGESTFPVSKATPFSRFARRSEAGRIEVGRLDTPLSSEQQAAVARSAQKRMGVFYDTGFDLDSKRQFCSRYVREVLGEAVGTQLGDIEDFSTLLSRNPNVDLTFWKTWYFGNIPWQRRTVTPASLLQSPRLHKVFDGYATAHPQAGRSGLRPSSPAVDPAIPGDHNGLVSTLV